MPGRGKQMNVFLRLGLSSYLVFHTEVGWAARRYIHHIAVEEAAMT